MDASRCIRSRSSHQLLALGIDAAADEASGVLPRHARLDGPTPVGSRTVIYEQIRSGRLLTVTQGRRRLVPASSMTAYIDLLVTEAMARTNARTP
jgi:hypothetical protein